MAPLPPYLVRIAASILTQALTRKLASSPLFFRIVDRLIHEYDHIPHRVQGRQVPPYQPPLSMRENEWQQDIGEPHDEPSPFGPSKHDSSKPSPKSFEEGQRKRARDAFAQAQRTAERDRQRQKQQQDTFKQDSVSNELKELQQKLREMREQNEKR